MQEILGTHLKLWFVYLSPVKMMAFQTRRGIHVLLFTHQNQLYLPQIRNFTHRRTRKMPEREPIKTVHHQNKHGNKSFNEEIFLKLSITADKNGWTPTKE